MTNKFIDQLPTNYVLKECSCEKSLQRKLSQIGNGSANVPYRIHFNQEMTIAFIPLIFFLCVMISLFRCTGKSLLGMSKRFRFAVNVTRGFHIAMPKVHPRHTETISVRVISYFGFSFRQCIEFFKKQAEKHKEELEVFKTSIMENVGVADTPKVLSSTQVTVANCLFTPCPYLLCI